MKRALIVGSSGQDGRILYDRLLQEGYAILGIASGSVRTTESSGFSAIDITDRRQVLDVVKSWKPHEIYYLAAFHHSSQDGLGSDPAALYAKSHAVHVAGLVHFLEAIKEAAPGARLFYAASSLAFGDAACTPQNEQTPLNPRCIYGITKATGVQCCRFYRETHGVFAVAGFLYNHESVYRQAKFVSQKIIRGAIEIQRGTRSQLALGDLSARIDWGYAPDSVEAMIRTLALPQAEDFVIATGETHSVLEFVQIVFGSLGIDWKAHVVEDAAILKRRNAPLIGEASKLRRLTGWQPTVTFAQMIEILVKVAMTEDVAPKADL